MNPPGRRFRVGHAALTLAEYFRDDEHRDVLPLIDNIFRFIQVGSEVSELLGRILSRLGCQPTMDPELADLEERIANTDSRAITLIQAVYLPALPPRILVHETAGDREVYTAIDDGLLVSTGAEVTVSVRRAIGGTDLAGLRDKVRWEAKAAEEGINAPPSPVRPSEPGRQAPGQ